MAVVGHNYFESILQDNLARQVSQEGIHLVRAEPESQLKDHVKYFMMRKPERESIPVNPPQKNHVNIQVEKCKHKFFYQIKILPSL